MVRRIPPVILVLLFVSFATGTSLSSSGRTQNQTARKVDEFGDILYSDLIARLDNFAVMLQAEPNSRGFLIVYGTRRDLPGLSSSLALRMKDYLVNQRGISKDHLFTLDGGILNCLTQELWIVPVGSAPTPRSEAGLRYPQLDSAWKFDEYDFLPPELYKRFGVSRTEDSDPEYLEAYANEVKKKRGFRACLIVYAQYNPDPGLVDYAGNYEPGREVRMDQPGTALKKLEFEKRILMRVYGLPTSRIRTIDGGYRKHRAVELWIVPAGEPLPIPTPNSFPPGRTRRHT
ncbi:MAG TPA: hypothetical protein VGJ55_08365 [Pyrinomonadaceae bacterium]